MGGLLTGPAGEWTRFCEWRVVAELTFSSDPRMTKVLRTVIHFFARQVGFDEEETMNLMLAADEACANIIRHAYGGAKDKKIHLSIESQPNRLEIIFEDTGVPMPPDRLRSQVVRPANEELKPGGLGTFFITSIMDQVRYESEPGKTNRLYLVKHLPPERKR